MAPNKIFCLQISVKDFVLMKTGKHIDILHIFIGIIYISTYLHNNICVYLNCIYKSRNTGTFLKNSTGT